MKTNAELQNDVYEELKWDSRVNEGDIGVSVKDGIVTLSGTIPSYAEKWAAEEAAHKVAGVTAVVNKIDVKLSNLHERDDQDIAEAALNAFAWNVWVPEKKVQLTVEKGWVTLTGEVAYDYQRKAAENAVKNLAGVRGVSNHIFIGPNLKVKDVQYQIKKALHRHAEEDANRIHVEARGSEVTLTGKVHSWDEKVNAEWAARGTAGVSAVRNNLSISYS